MAIRAIYIPKQPAWWCKKCAKSSLTLYRDDKGSQWFDCCVPEEVKAKAKYYNQNREEIEVKE